MTYRFAAIQNVTDDRQTTQCAKGTTGSTVGQKFITACRLLQLLLTNLTDDRRQFIILSVHLRVQHDGRDVARLAGSSAADETCY